MKKITLGFLVVLAAMAFVVGCSNFGASGNPTELTGTWTGSTTSFGPSQSIADGFEGTWEKTTLTPATATSTSTTAGVTLTTYYDTFSRTKTDTYVIAADGSFVRTVVVTGTRVARDAIVAVGTGTNQTAGFGALTAGSYTITNVTTVTVTPQIDGNYTERTVVTSTGSATGSLVGNTDPDFVLGLVALSATAQVYGSDDTTANNALGSLSFLGAATYDQIAAGADLGFAYDRQTDTEYSLVIAENGGYTLTTTITYTDVAPGEGGTAVYTSVETGTVLGATATGFNAGASLVTFNETNLETTYEGTGTLISASYPATAVTVTQAVAVEKIYEYLITKGTSNTYLQVFSPTIVSAGYNNPWTTLVKSGT